MGSAKFLTDEHVARAIVVGLRQRGIDVVSLPEANLLGSSDIDLLNYAHADGRIIVTHDSDFYGFTQPATLMPAWFSHRRTIRSEISYAD